MKEKLLLVIPAYNEEENLVRVVDDLMINYPEYDYVIVNDGSSDRTRELCIGHHYRFIDYPINLGLTSAFRGGMYYGMEHGYDYILQYDGDGQHDPSYIKDLLECAVENRANILVGSRFVQKRKPFSARMFGSRIITNCIALTTGRRIKDPTSGMRMYDRRAMDLIAKQRDFGPEPDTLAYLIRNGLEVAEVQVEMKERIAGTSYLTLTNSIRYMLHMCFSILVVGFLRNKER